MPKYKPGTKQWAMQRLDELRDKPTKLTGVEEEEFDRLMDGVVTGAYKDDPNPVYSKEELEAQGQGSLL